MGTYFDNSLYAAALPTVRLGRGVGGRGLGLVRAGACRLVVGDARRGGLRLLLLSSDRELHPPPRSSRRCRLEGGPGLELGVVSALFGDAELVEEGKVREPCLLGLSLQSGNRRLLLDSCRHLIDGRRMHSQETVAADGLLEVGSRLRAAAAIVALIGLQPLVHRHRQSVQPDQFELDRRRGQARSRSRDDPGVVGGGGAEGEAEGVERAQAARWPSEL
eukprot:159119-Hanusia_phi.AAC.1